MISMSQQSGSSFPGALGVGCVGRLFFIFFFWVGGVWVVRWQACFIPPVFPVGLCWGPERAALPAALLHAYLSGAFNKSHCSLFEGRSAKTVKQDASCPLTSKRLC